jgi:hypothetical protein
MDIFHHSTSHNVIADPINNHSRVGAYATNILDNLICLKSNILISIFVFLQKFYKNFFKHLLY